MLPQSVAREEFHGILKPPYNCILVQVSSHELLFFYLVGNFVGTYLEAMFLADC